MTRLKSVEDEIRSLPVKDLIFDYFPKSFGVSKQVRYRIKEKLRTPLSFFPMSPEHVRSVIDEK